MTFYEILPIDASGTRTATHIRYCPPAITENSPELEPTDCVGVATIRSIIEPVPRSLGAT